MSLPGKWKCCLVAIGLAVGGALLASGLASLVLFSDQLEPVLAEPGKLVKGYQNAWSEPELDREGNELTGQASAWIAALGMLPVALDMASRQAISRAPLSVRIKNGFRRFNQAQRKILMPLHTWFSLLGLSIGLAHLFLSSCPGNPFPEWGLVLMGTLSATGLLVKLRIVPKALVKRIYQFHASLLLSGLLVVILLAGHLWMD
jgi:hypothetical protein